MSNLSNNNIIFKQGTMFAIKNIIGGAQPANMHESSKIVKLLIIIVILMIIFIYVGYQVEIKTAKKMNRKPIPFMLYIGFSSKYSLESIGVGMVSNMIFGLMDNISLMFGMDALSEYFPGGPLTKAAYGNMVSGTISSTFGEFAGSIITNLTQIEDTPLWSQTLGFAVGGLIGIYLPLMIINDPIQQCD